MGLTYTVLHLRGPLAAWGQILDVPDVVGCAVWAQGLLSEGGKGGPTLYKVSSPQERGPVGLCALGLRSCLSGGEII